MSKNMRKKTCNFQVRKWGLPGTNEPKCIRKKKKKKKRVAPFNSKLIENKKRKRKEKEVGGGDSRVVGPGGTK